MPTRPSSDAAAFKAFEAEGWHARAGGYDRLTGAVTARVAEPLLDAVGAGPGTRLLDVATGTGRLAAAAADRGARVTGIDLAEAMLAAARARRPDLDLRRADAEALPFGAASYTAATAGFVFNHLPRPERAAAELARVLAPGGRVAAAVWDVPSRNRLTGIIADAIEEAGARGGALPAGPDPYRFADDGAFADLLAEAGFGDVRLRTLELTVPVGSAEEYWSDVLGGSVRAAAELAGASAAVRRRARAVVERELAAHRTGTGHELPAVVKLAGGRRPAGA
jgi:ubiquinone/menaquinone biosynthesis C-methylase UbiE